eukprot:TRINITY_DN9308_c0_g2_i10.p1 TRINITY_DN9308_c0_g2~~TRINITY_DN9308_c0_g2_i10.p1  ORF type:complete len:148 (-),score=24.11 TRINITY_DN9308_c0_g2_i10:65-508(-)
MGPVKRAALKKHHNHNPALMKFSHVQAVRILEAKNLDTETVALEIDELLCPKHVRKGGGSLRRYDPTTVESRVKFRSLCDGVCLLNPGCASLFVPDTPQMTAMRSVSGDTATVLPDGRLNSHMFNACLLYTSPSPRDRTRSRMPSSA